MKEIGWLVVAKPTLAVVIPRYLFSLYLLLVELTHELSSLGGALRVLNRVDKHIFFLKPE